MHEVEHFTFSKNSKNYIAHIYYDEDVPNPRGTDNWLGHFVMYHNKYDFSDEEIKRKFPDIEDLYDYFEQTKCVKLPVYMLDHSGLTISTSSFNDPWDSGCVGVIFLSEEEIKKYLGKSIITREDYDNIITILSKEIDYLDIWVRGDIYGFVVIDKDTDEQIESCWGFYDLDECKEAIKDSV